MGDGGGCGRGAVAGVLGSALVDPVPCMKPWTSSDWTGSALNDPRGGDRRSCASKG